MPDPTAISLESTLEAFRDGITTSLSASAGASVAEGWADKLDGLDRDDLGGIRDGLRELAGLLRAGALDRTAIGQTLQSLGSHTAEVAPTADDADVDRLERLAGALQATGRALASDDEIAGYPTGPAGDAAHRNLQDRNTADALSDHATGES